MPSRVLETVVFCTTRFEANHRWRDAPDDFPLLRNYHRHEFHVRLSKRVRHDNRDVEFINLKRDVNTFLKQNWVEQFLDLSCEQMASRLLLAFDAVMVEVSEDGENGAVVYGMEEDA